jgi:hypothetical protein
LKLNQAGKEKGLHSGERTRQTAYSPWHATHSGRRWRLSLLDILPKIYRISNDTSWQLILGCTYGNSARVFCRRLEEEFGRRRGPQRGEKCKSGKLLLSIGELLPYSAGFKLTCLACLKGESSYDPKSREKAGVRFARMPTSFLHLPPTSLSSCRSLFHSSSLFSTREQQSGLRCVPLR